VKVLTGAQRCKAVGKYDQKLKVRIIVRGQTDTMIRPCCAIKTTATWQSSEIRVSVLEGIDFTLCFYFELPLTCFYQIRL